MTKLRVEFHCHSVFSKDSLNSIPRLLKAARERKIDRLVITDHSTIRGALLAREMDPELVIVGEEILTTRGELLASFVKEEIPRGLEPMEAIRRLREQGAFISVSHPFDLMRHGWEYPDLLEITPYVDAIEIFNSRCVSAETNVKAQQYAQEKNLAGTVGSDAHSILELGRSTLLLPEFASADGLRDVIREGKAETRLSSPLIHFTSRWAVMVKAFRNRSQVSAGHSEKTA